MPKRLEYVNLLICIVFFKVQIYCDGENVTFFASDNNCLMTVFSLVDRKSFPGEGAVPREALTAFFTCTRPKT
jgi:hypothetical protein